MNPVRRALQHVRDAHGWARVAVPEVRPRPDGFLVVVRVRDDDLGVSMMYGVKVGRRGRILDGEVVLEDPPRWPESNRNRNRTGRTR